MHCEIDGGCKQDGWHERQPDAGRPVDRIAGQVEPLRAQARQDLPADEKPAEYEEDNDGFVPEAGYRVERRRDQILLICRQLAVFPEDLSTQMPKKNRECSEAARQI
jgi:hypothetical protein